MFINFLSINYMKWKYVYQRAISYKSVIYFQASTHYKEKNSRILVDA